MELQKERVGKSNVRSNGLEMSVKKDIKPQIQEAWHNKKNKNLSLGALHGKLLKTKDKEKNLKGITKITSQKK